MAMTEEEVSTVVDVVMEAVTTDEVVDLDSLREILKLLNEKKKAIVDAEKAAADAEKAKSTTYAPTYYASLKNGEKFSYRKTDGTVVELTKIATKSNSGRSAAGMLVGWNPDLPENKGKRGTRYPKFAMVIVPQEWIDAAHAQEEMASASA